MKRMNAGTLGLDQGSLMLFSDFQDEGPMWAGDGPREVTRSVNFSAPFRDPPAVWVGISLWDVDCTTNLRADLSARNVTVAGFDLVFGTWGDTRIARLRADWTALGPATSPDDWDV